MYLSTIRSSAKVLSSNCSHKIDNFHVTRKLVSVQMSSDFFCIVSSVCVIFLFHFLFFIIIGLLCFQHEYGFD